MLCTAPGLVSAVLGCTMNDLSKASSHLRANPDETAFGCRETCLCETLCPKPGVTGTAKEERFEVREAMLGVLVGLAQVLGWV